MPSPSNRALGVLVPGVVVRLVGWWAENAEEGSTVDSVNPSASVAPCDAPTPESRVEALLG